MLSVSIEIDRGRRALAGHRFGQALRHFDRALRLGAETRGLPQARRSIDRATIADLHRYRALCLQKFGMRNMALASLVEAARLVKRGVGRRELARHQNQYGMARQATTLLDDQHAFYGIQVARYLRSKKSHRLGTRAEVDMVVELIGDHWSQIVRGGGLEGMDADERLRAFTNTSIIFPFLSVPQGVAPDNMAVDFTRGARVRPRDRCTCGSGLPYRSCHGRLRGIDEVLAGSF